MGVLVVFVLGPELGDELGFKLLAGLVGHLEVLTILAEDDLARQGVGAGIVAVVEVELHGLAMAVRGSDQLVPFFALHRNVVFHDIQVDVVEIKTFLSKSFFALLFVYLYLVFSEFCKVFFRTVHNVVLRSKHHPA